MFSLPNYPPSCFGGVAVSVEAVISGLAQVESSFQIWVLTTSFGLPEVSNVIKNRWTTKDGYRVKYISSKKPQWSIRVIVEGCLLITRMKRVQLSGIFFLPNIFHAYFGVLLGKKVFWSPHGELMKPAFYSKFWKKAPFLILVFIISPWITFRVTSTLEEGRIKNLFPFSRIGLIPNIIPQRDKVSVPKKEQFLFLGRVARIKSLTKIIEACRLSSIFIRNKYTFIFAGPRDNASKGYFEEIIQNIERNGMQDRIKYVGEVFSPEKEALLSESKVLFLVSESENFGNVIVEALQQGTPVVASKGTPWASLYEKECGLWIDSAPEEIAKAIDYFIEMNNTQYEAMCVKAIEYSMEFREEIIIPLWIRLIKG